MEKYHRVSLRLQGYNYSSAGLYFITICTKDRECLFGEIADGQMLMNGFGMIVKKEWLKTPTIRPNIELDDFVIMPNHFHGIIRIKDDRRGGVTPPLQNPTLGEIVGYFKYQTTKQINVQRNCPGQIIWQRGYYDHIVCDDRDLNRVREYIQNNPLTWDTDENNP
jgi:REP element-mobilizing transposase RayT